ncbi:MAG: HAMP domain-containing histidine kinase [Chloroflexi bacterium]|nr:HAMP domain-containing histidine kinase [Chloroflexota bacterium]
MTIWPLRWPTLSLRLRLTLWYSLTLAVTLWIFAGFLYTSLAQNLADEIDKTLNDRALELNRSIRLDTFIARGGRVRLELPNPDVFATGDTFVQLVTLDGEVIAASANLAQQDLPITPEALAATRDGHALYQTTQVGDTAIRLFDAPIVVAGRSIGMLQVARSLQTYRQSLIRLRAVTIFGGLASVVCSALIGSALARTALRPLERFARTAEEIGEARDFSRRVDYRGPRDELGRLATTFNRMLERLQDAYAGLEAALASQRRFVADASHELRTPLTTIRGNASLLQQVPHMTPADRDDAIAQIVGESERLSRLVQDLLTLARADAGLHLARHPVGLRGIVAEVIRQARFWRDGVLVQAGELGDATVIGDADTLRQLAVILVDNAVKYTPAGGSVTVSLVADEGTAVLEVADTGIGISAEDLPHVFERFYRADRARSAGGTGLGLAIARWIVTEHNGRIDVVSEAGKGTTFIVRLPASITNSYQALTST